MQSRLNIVILSIYSECEIQDEIIASGDQTIREAVMDYINKNNIEHTGCSVVFPNIEDELKSHSLVAFLNDEPLLELVDEKIETLATIFYVEHLTLTINIGGIGGEVGNHDGFYFYIYTSNEHLPKHIHCRKQKKICKCYIETLTIVQNKNSHSHFSTKEQRYIQNYVRDNKDYFETAENSV